jgi:hypothetical protein
MAQPSPVRPLRIVAPRPAVPPVGSAALADSLDRICPTR